MVHAELLGVTDDTRGIAGGLVRSVDAVQVVGSCVFQVVTQMPDCGKSFRGPEHLFAVALAGDFCIAPMHPDRLLILTLDGRDPYPDLGLASLCIPTLDLVGQWLAIGGEADVLAPGLSLAEIEIVLVQPNQLRDVFIDGPGWQVRARGGGDNVYRTRVFPGLILGRSLRKESGKTKNEGTSDQGNGSIKFQY